MKLTRRPAAYLHMRSGMRGIDRLTPEQADTPGAADVASEPGSGGHDAHRHRHGSHSGIGRPIAVAQAVTGFEVGITYNRDRYGAEAPPSKCAPTAARLPYATSISPSCPTPPDVVDELADALAGDLRVLVNGSGTGPDGTVLDLSLLDWRTALPVDLVGAFLCLQRAARRMVGGEPAVANITSVHAHRPRVGASAYCAAQGGLGLLTKPAALVLV